MLVVVDSGSTKADWKFGPAEENLITTKGFNPFFHDRTFILEELQKSALAAFAEQVTELNFYGAGCSSAERNLIVYGPLTEFFPNAKVLVDHDILGAAIATNGDKEGISCIIGTGSNSCYYNGEKLFQVVPALGYLLGDEASGSYLGKRLLSDYLYKLLPEPLHTALEKDFKLTKEIIFQHAYQEPNVNVYFASFARLYTAHRELPYVQEVVAAGFHLFLDIHIMRYPRIQEIPLNFVGSIAFYFEDLLTQVLESKKLVKGRILRKPIHELYRHFAERGTAIS
jgi:N-acetylglucosamine kinase-like BadF-type ATPase